MLPLSVTYSWCDARHSKLLLSLHILNVGGYTG